MVTRHYSVHVTTCMDSDNRLLRGRNAAHFINELRELGVDIHDKPEIRVRQNAGNTVGVANPSDLFVNISHHMNDEKTPTCGGAMVTDHADHILHEVHDFLGLDKATVAKYFTSKGLDPERDALFDVARPYERRAEEHAGQLKRNGAIHYVSGSIDLKTGKVRIIDSSYDNLVGKVIELPDAKGSELRLKEGKQKPAIAAVFSEGEKLEDLNLNEKPGVEFAISADLNRKNRERTDPHFIRSILYYIYNARKQGITEEEMKIRVLGKNASAVKKWFKEDEILKAIAAKVKIE